MQRLAAPRRVAGDRSEQQRGAAGLRDDRRGRVERRIDEHLAVQQVARWITCDGQFRNHHEVGAGAHALFVGVSDQLHVGVKSADGRIELPDEDFHWRVTLPYDPFLAREPAAGVNKCLKNSERST